MPAARLEPLEARRLLAVFAPVGQQPTGPLTGRIVYASGGHGYTSDDAGLWDTQRDEVAGTEMVEDFGNQDQLTYYADHLWRAGATVVPMRPVGNQLAEVVVDNMAATFAGSWSDGASVPYFSTDDGDGVKYRSAVSSPTETAVATFAPDLPTAGYYPVYAWALDGSNRSAEQVYRVNHAGGATEVKVNHQWVGKGWVYLGTYFFKAGPYGSVEVSNRGADTSKVVIADAIRFGNGRGDSTDGGPISGESREDEASLYWVARSAGYTAPGTLVSSSNWRTSSDDGTANVSAPLRWATYMNAAPAPAAGGGGTTARSVYLSFHSNAGGGRGTDGLHNTPHGTNTPNQLAWARLAGREVQDDLVATGTPTLEYAWANSADPVYASPTITYGEISATVNGSEFDATILEVAFHDSPLDAALMRDPFVRDKVGQSTTQATVRYFGQFGGGTVAFAPDAPTNVRTSVDRATGAVTVRWDAAPAGVFGGAATGFRVYGSRDGQGFDGGVAVAGAATRSVTFPKSQLGNGVVHLRVSATNPGGESPPSAVVSVRVGDARLGRVLIVDGFDRLDRTQNVPVAYDLFDTNATTKNRTSIVDRVRPRQGNSFDYSVRHAQAIANHPSLIGFDTTDNGAVADGRVSLAGYQAVIWIAGEESTADESFSSTEQAIVASYVNGGGKLMVSGSEVGWDLVAQNGGASFFTNTLRAGYVSDDAGTYAAAGVAGSIFAGLSLAFDDGSAGTYDVDFPDRLSTINGSVSVLSYSGGTGGTAATAWSGGNGARTLMLGLPFETITTAANRAALMRRALDFLGFGSTLIPSPQPAPRMSPTLAAVPASGSEEKLRAILRELA